MRKKIAKRIRRQCIKGGMKIIREEFISEPGWKRKDCGMEVVAEFHGWKIVACGKDLLESYRMLAEEIKDEQWYMQSRRE